MGFISGWSEFSVKDATTVVEINCDKFSLREMSFFSSTGTSLPFGNIDKADDEVSDEMDEVSECDSYATSWTPSSKCFFSTTMHPLAIACLDFHAIEIGASNKTQN